MENNQIFGELWILCIAGGSGAGKTSAVRRLLKKYPHLTFFSVSGSTRLPGEGEVDGKDYYFFSHRQFSELESKGMFIETNPFATGHRYGTLLSEFEKARKQNKVLIVDCEINGALQILSKYKGHAACIFLDVTNNEAAERLGGASTRKREKIPERIKNLQEQREIVRKSKEVQMIFDTTGLDEEIVFSVVDKFFLEELNVRKSITTQ